VESHLVGGKKPSPKPLNLLFAQPAGVNSK
jgi:hypothetical protein